MNSTIKFELSSTTELWHIQLNKERYIMDKFGDRMKGYEKQFEQKLVPMLPVYARLDGRSFSNFTRGMKRPYDERLSQTMIDVTKYLVKETNASIGYTQSDEISLAWYFPDVKSQFDFQGKIMKVVSTLSAMATGKFVMLGMERFPEVIEKKGIPQFDCRVCNFPNLEECTNMFLWREMDASKNSISMAARAFYSHKALDNKNGSEKQELLFQKGVNWNDYPPFFKRGTFVRKEKIVRDLTSNELAKIPENKRPASKTVTRTVISELELPAFSKVKNRSDVLFFGANPLLEGDL